MVLDPFAVRVEQVRDAVQRHHCLAGARATLDHQHPRVIEPDDLVLLGLNRRDDVAHAVTARRVDRREQGGVAPASPLCVTGPAEDLVGEIDDVTPARVELAAATHVLRRRSGGDVESPCRGCPPVKQQRLVLVLLVEDADPADVRVFAEKCVQPAETQPVVGYVEPPHLFGQRSHLGIPLHERAAVLRVDGAPQCRVVATLHLGALGVEPVVELGHIAPLRPQFVFVFSS